MLYLVLFLLLAILSLPFLLRVSYIVEYDGVLLVKIKLLFIKKTLFSSTKIEEISPFEIINNISGAKDIVFDLYKKFKGSLKLKSLTIRAKISSYEPYMTAMLYGATESIVYAFIGFLDSIFELQAGKVNTSINACFSENKSSLALNLTFYTSLFSFVLFSTYAFLKGAIKGGKNGRKQAKRNDKNRA